MGIETVHRRKAHEWMLEWLLVGLVEGVQRRRPAKSGLCLNDHATS